jgi:hypothetical protein
VKRAEENFSGNKREEIEGAKSLTTLLDTQDSFEQMHMQRFQVFRDFDSGSRDSPFDNGHSRKGPCSWQVLSDATGIKN